MERRCSSISLLPTLAGLALAGTLSAQTPLSPDRPGRTRGYSVETLGAPSTTGEEIRFDGRRAWMFLDEAQAGRDFNGDGELSIRVFAYQETAQGGGLSGEVVVPPWRPLPYRLDAVYVDGDLILSETEDGWVHYDPFLRETTLLRATPPEGRLQLIGAGHGRVLFEDDGRLWVVPIADPAAAATVSHLQPVSDSLQFENQVLFTAREAGFDPPVDLNGDGDTLDLVAQLYDLETGQIANLGLGISPTLRGSDFIGESVYVQGSEFFEGRDLNGDGDLSDRVLHRYTISSGILTNLGVHTSDNLRPAGVQDWVVFAVNEGDSDLSGDGDSHDWVLFAYEPGTDTLVNTGHATDHPETLNLWLGTQLFSTPQVVGVRVLESEALEDYNADGDLNDWALVVRRFAQGVTDVAGTDVDLLLRARGWLVLFTRNEALAGQDLNGDGDQLDSVGHLYNGRTGETTNLGLGLEGSTLGTAGERAAFAVSEHAEGRDLNDDGDLLDFVLHDHDTQTGVTRNLGLAMGRFPAFPPREDGGYLPITVNEASQGEDVNGSGALREAVFVLNAEGILKNLRSEVVEPFRTNHFGFRDGLLALGLREGTKTADGELTMRIFRFDF